MKKRIITILIILAVLSLIIYIAHRVTLGDEGLVTQASNVEIEYNKKEILNILKKEVNEKYLESYNSTKENADQKIEDIYNTSVALEYLKEKNYIEYYYYTNYNEEEKKYSYATENITEETAKRDDIFFINAKNAIQDVEQFGKGEKYLEDEINKNDVFLLEKKQDSEDIYLINYYNSEGKKEEIGELNLKEPI